MPRLPRRTVLSGTALALGSVVGSAASAHRSSTGGTEVWTHETDNVVYSSPTVTDRTVYVGSNDATLYALDRETGAERWTADVDGRIVGAPAVRSGSVFVSAGWLYAVDAQTGEIQWQNYDRPFHDLASPTVAVVDGVPTVYVGTSRGVLAADARTGAERWWFPVADSVLSSPTVVEGSGGGSSSGATVYVGSGEAFGADSTSLFALDAATGELRWEYETGGAIEGSPTVANDTVYVGSDDGYVHAVDPATGEQTWRFSVESVVRSTPTAGDGALFVGDVGGHVYALDPATGEEQWRHYFGDRHRRVDNSPTVAGDLVVVGEVGPAVQALRAEDGSVAWSFDTGALDREYVVTSSSSPTVAEGVCYVGSGDGSVYAIDAGVDASSEGSRVADETLGYLAFGEAEGQLAGAESTDADDSEGSGADAGEGDGTSADGDSADDPGDGTTDEENVTADGDGETIDGDGGSSDGTDEPSDETDEDADQLAGPGVVGGLAGLLGARYVLDRREREAE